MLARSPIGTQVNLFPQCNPATSHLSCTLERCNPPIFSSWRWCSTRHQCDRSWDFDKSCDRRQTRICVYEASVPTTFDTSFQKLFLIFAFAFSCTASATLMTLKKTFISLVSGKYKNYRHRANIAGVRLTFALVLRLEESRTSDAVVVGCGRMCWSVL